MAVNIRKFKENHEKEIVEAEAAYVDAIIRMCGGNDNLITSIFSDTVFKLQLLGNMAGDGLATFSNYDTN